MTRLQKTIKEMTKDLNDGYALKGKEIIEKIKEKLLDYGFIEKTNNILEVPDNELFKKNDFIFEIFLHENHMTICTGIEDVRFFYNKFSAKLFDLYGNFFNIDDILTKTIILFENTATYKYFLDK